VTKNTCREREKGRCERKGGKGRWEGKVGRDGGKGR
jgi:hypothetical protein